MATADQIGRLLSQRIEKAVRFLALEVVANLVEDTPVDLGWARANWRATIGQRAYGVVGVAPRGREARRVPSSAIGSASGTIARYRLGMGGIYITNNVPYIRRLNRGWSSQQPAGWIERAHLRAIQRTVTVFGRSISL